MEQVMNLYSSYVVDETLHVYLSMYSESGTDDSLYLFMVWRQSFGSGIIVVFGCSDFFIRPVRNNFLPKLNSKAPPMFRNINGGMVGVFPVISGTHQYRWAPVSRVICAIGHFRKSRKSDYDSNLYYILCVEFLISSSSTLLAPSRLREKCNAVVASVHKFKKGWGRAWLNSCIMGISKAIRRRSAKCLSLKNGSYWIISF